MRSVSAAIQTALESLTEPKPIVLVELVDAGTRYTSWHATHQWSSLTWTPVAMGGDGFRETLKLDAPRADLSLTSLGASFQATLAADSYRGDDCRIRVIRSDDIGTSEGALWDTTYTVDTDGSDQDEVRLSLASSDAVQGTEVPRISTREVGCQRDYKKRGCSYRGPLETCDKTLTGPNGCMAHFPDLTDPDDATLTIPQHYPYLAFKGRVSNSLLGQT